MKKNSLQKRILGLVGIAAILITLSATMAAAVLFQPGDVFASVGPNATLGGNVVRHYNNTGAFIENLIVPELTYSVAGSAFDSSGNLYVTLFGFQNVSIFNNTGVFQNYFGSGYNANPESILFDAAGNAYVGQADGQRKILKFDSNGNPLANYSPAVGPRGTDWIDLAADQRTIYYTSEGKAVKRFDVVSNTNLTDFATGLPGSAAYALRILPSGGVLVADTDAVIRLNATGGIVQTYPAPPNASVLFALNLDPDGTSFWTGDIFGGKVYKFDISTGALLLTINASAQGQIGDLAGIGVFGEITAAKPTGGSISGVKFNDLNGNGIKDPGEPGLANWTIKLGGYDTLTRTVVSRTAVTDANGNYAFTNVTPGRYNVFEYNKPKWNPTTPWSVGIILGANQSIVIDFGNKQVLP